MAIARTAQQLDAMPTREIVGRRVAVIGRISDWIYLRRRRWRCVFSHRLVESDHWCFDPIGGGYVCLRCEGWCARPGERISH